MAKFDPLQYAIRRSNAELMEQLESRRSKKNLPSGPVWEPIPNSPQLMAYQWPVDELFYGGAGGAGKTDLLIGLAGTRQKRSLIIRREFPRVRGIIERSREIFARGISAHAKDSFNESLHLWRLSDGKTIEMGSVQYEKDWVKYQGQPHDLKAFDEITEFTEKIYRSIIIWNRSTDDDVRCRVVATGNPPTTIEGEWVIDYWAPWLDEDYPDPAMPGDLAWFVRLKTEDGDIDKEIGRTPRKEVERCIAKGIEPKRPTIEVNGKVLEGRSRTFIPGRVEDNPYLMATGYDKQLDALPEELRIRFREGRFIRVKESQEFQVIPTQWVLDAISRGKSQQRPNAPIRALGVDPSRGGDDSTVLCKRINDWYELAEHKGDTTNDGTKVALLARDVVGGMPIPIHVDVIGIGASPLDAMNQIGLNPIPLNSSEAAVDAFGEQELDKTGKIGFVNKRALWYWRLREMLEPGSGYNVVLPDDKKLRQELCAPRYKLKGWKIAVESKDEIKKKVGRSPDRADALVYASVEMPPVGTDWTQTVAHW